MYINKDKYIIKKERRKKHTDFMCLCSFVLVCVEKRTSQNPIIKKSFYDVIVFQSTDPLQLDLYKHLISSYFQTGWLNPSLPPNGGVVFCPGPRSPWVKCV